VKAEQFPSLPFDEYNNCLFQQWRTREIVFASLSLVYGTFCQPPHHPRHSYVSIHFIQDASAFLVIVYVMRNRGLTHTAGVPSILENILRDATSYFFVIFTSHLLLVLFELLAPVSNSSINSPLLIASRT